MEKLLQWMVTRRCRAAEVVAGIASAKVAAGAGQEISPAEVAAGAPSVEVAADAYPAKNIKTQRQMAGQMTSSVWHLLTQWHRRCQSDSCSNKNEPTEAERIAQGWCESCVWRRGAACVDAAGITLTGDGRTRMRDTHN